MAERKKINGVIQLMNKKLRFILVLSFILCFSGSSYCEEPEVKKEFWDNGKLKKQLQYANNNNITNVIIIGEDEIKSNIYTLKNMKIGTQEKLSIEKLISKLS